MHPSHALRAIGCGLAIAIATSGSPALAQTERAEAQNDEGGAANAWRWPGTIVWELSLRGGAALDTDFDRALAAHGYGKLGFVPGVTAALSFPVGVEWLWLGGQIGARGRSWPHADRDAARAFGLDLLAFARARFRLHQRIELGLSIGGGLGWLDVRVNGVGSDQIVPRFEVQADLAFPIGRHFALGPRIGWSYFVREGINAYGHAVELGGPYFGLSLEGRE
ncbi:MAG TPA: hypothetical protein VIL20_08370 [Sandaracinaceae bacterium]